MRTGVMCAVRSAGEAALVAALDAPGTRLSVVRRCADMPEVIAAAHAGVARIAVLSADLAGLDRASLARVRAAGVRIVLLADRLDRERSLGLGVEAVLDVAAPVEEVVRAARACAEDPADDVDEADPDAPLEADPPATGRVCAVWGPHGAPGRTTLAVNLAAELADLDESVLLVDADTWGGAVAQTIGLLDESPGLAAATRAASNGSLDTVALARLGLVVEPRLRVLTGLSRPDRWRELPAAGLDAVWETARGLASWTVVDCGFSIEDEPGTGFEAMLGPRRNAATASALAAADVVVVVGAGEPVGIQRLVQALQDLAEAGLVQARRVVVVNRIRASAAGPYPEQAVVEALVRYAGVEDPVLVPDDRAALDRAMLAGETLRVAAPHSPARLAVAALARDLAGRGEQPAGSRGLRGRLTRRAPRAG